MRRGFGLMGGVLVAVAAVALLGGCAASKNYAKDRMKVLEAENVDVRQQQAATQRVADEAQSGHDRAVADLQRERHEAQRLQQEKDAAMRQAALGEDAQRALALHQEETQRRTAEIRQLYKDTQRLQVEVAKVKETRIVQMPEAKPSATLRPNHHVDAFRRDLQSRLAGAGINLPVETRMTCDGDQQVAVVLRGAFPSGKDSLAYDMDAVRCVVGLGELINTQYAGSRVRVEGHTDSDPIRRSPWASNQALSLARAQAVKELMVKAGVSSGSIDAVGLGATVPLEHANTKQAKAANRRVEIYILPASN